MSDDERRKEEEDDGTQRRMGVQKLAALALLGTDEELKRFRKQRLRGAEGVDDSQLWLMRDVLLMLVDLLGDDDRAAWERLEEAERALAPEPPAPEPAPEEVEEQPSDPPVEPSGPPVPKRIDEPDDGTDDEERPAPLAAASPAAPSPWTKFTNAAHAAAADAPVAPPPPSARVPQSTRTPAVTMGHDQLNAAARASDGPVLPFVPPSRPSAPASDSPPSGGPRSRARGQTAELSCTSGAHGLALSLREYAALCAEREAFPQNSREICDRYDVHGEDVLQALELLFRHRFQASPSLRSQFEQQRVRFLHQLKDVM